VQSAGGWLFDQVMAGWDVTVVTADQADPRPLHILGVRARDLDSLFATTAVLGPCLQAVAVRSELYDADERVRRLVLTAAESGNADIRLWGDVWPDDFEGAADSVSHRLSLAARAFKARPWPRRPSRGSRRRIPRCSAAARSGVPVWSRRGSRRYAKASLTS